MCHSYCRDLVHLDGPQHGKSPRRMCTGEANRPRGQHPQVGTVGVPGSEGRRVTHLRESLPLPRVSAPSPSSLCEAWKLSSAAGCGFGKNVMARVSS